MAARSATWTLPTTYANGDPITTEDQALIVTHIFMDGAEIGASKPGESTWTGDVVMVQGQTYHFTATCEINGQFSVASPEVTFEVPFFPPNPPTGLAIT